MKRLLITTPISESWQEDVPVLFLGEWCKLFSEKLKWSKLDYQVVSYHWNDRVKLLNDYKYLNEVREIFLKLLVIELNQIHNVQKSVHYWRILIGPWLGVFLQILYDRWFMIDFALRNYAISEALIVDTSSADNVPFDMNSFQKMMISDSWNAVMYSEALQSHCNITLKKILIDPVCVNNIRYSSRFSKIKQSAVSFLTWLSGRVTERNDFFFLSTYLPKKYELLLQFKLAQIPKFWISPSASKSTLQADKRIFTLASSANETLFEIFAKKMVVKYLPTLYLEGYETILKSVKKFPWPATPKAIFTSNSFFEDEFFKVWAAEKVSNGTPLFIGQHGGNYGVSLFNFSEDHEVEISDNYLSWGWEDENKKWIKPLFNLKMIHARQSWNPKGNLFVVTMALPRYSYHMYAIPISSQYLDYLQDQFRFVSALPNFLQREILVRVFPEDFGWSQEDRWKDCFPEINIDDGKTSMKIRVAQCRIYISTYNATTFLETLLLNVPTIIYWNPLFWELREGAIPYFDELRNVGILHDTPESAASKVSEVWHNVQGWWSQDLIQDVRLFFCERFSRKCDNPISLLGQTLQDVVGSRIREK